MAGLRRLSLNSTSRLLDIFCTSQKRTFCDTHVRWTMRTNRNAEAFKKRSGIQPRCMYIKNVSAQLSTAAKHRHPFLTPNDLVEMDISETEAEEELASLVGDDKKQLQVLKLEHDLFLTSGEPVPTNMTSSMWLYVFKNCKSVNQRTRFYKYKHIIEKKQARDEEIKKEKQISSAEKMARAEARRHAEGYVMENTFLLKLTDTTTKRYNSNNLHHAMIHGPVLCFDFDYEFNVMSELELSNLGKQIQICYGENKAAADPFHLHFCNLREGSLNQKYLQKHFVNYENIILTSTEDSYLEHYPHEDLVYLSPNAPNVMTRYDPTKVYIIGGLVDKSVEQKLSVAKAKKEKITHLKLPLDTHLK